MFESFEFQNVLRLDEIVENKKRSEDKQPQKY